MTDIQKAMLGDKEASERLTERGELLPCQCGCNKQMIGIVPSTNIFGERGWKAMLECNQCLSTFSRFAQTKENAEKSVCLAWNTRPQLLTKEQIEALERMEEE